MSVRASCAQHRDRPAQALCMSCRTPVCQECSTTWEGIHYCARCLANERRRSVSRRSPVVVMVVVVLAAGLFWATTRLTVMTVVLMERLW